MLQLFAVLCEEGNIIIIITIMCTAVVYTLKATCCHSFLYCIHIYYTISNILQNRQWCFIRDTPTYSYLSSAPLSAYFHGSENYLLPSQIPVSEHDIRMQTVGLGGQNNTRSSVFRKLFRSIDVRALQIYKVPSVSEK